MSDHKIAARKRRDERQTRTPVIRPVSGSHRDTKRWCRGVEGRAHKPECRQEKDSRLSDWRVLACARCGKHLDYFFPSSLRTGKRRPAWVTF